jgi:hypothetical protein
MTSISTNGTPACIATSRHAARVTSLLYTRKALCKCRFAGSRQAPKDVKHTPLFPS